MTDEDDNFPDWMMPTDPNVDPPMSDYLALAEWYWAHRVSADSREDLREIAAERRTRLLAEGIDLSGDIPVSAVFFGWHHAVKSFMNFLPYDCEPDQHAHMRQHTVRCFEFCSIILLLTLEPDTPNPPKEIHP